MTLITNHTFSNLLLRPPGLQAKGPPPDEKVYKAFGKSMADENGYSNQKSYELYDTSGGTEDWTYYATGGFGFTFEIGLLAFHDIFADGVVAEYNGTSEASGRRRRKPRRLHEGAQEHGEQQAPLPHQGQRPGGRQADPEEDVHDADLARHRRQRRGGRR